MFNLIPWKKKEPAPPSVLITGPDATRIDRLRGDFESLVDRFWGALGDREGDWLQNGLGWSFGIEESDNEYLVRAEAPGFEAADFDVEVRGNYLSISAEHNEEKADAPNGRSYHYGRFQRSTPLPPGADADGLTARYHSGVLEIHLPKTASSHSKRITVTAD